MGIRLQFNENDDFVEWRYEHLYLMGTKGKCDIDIEEWANLPGLDSWEFGRKQDIQTGPIIASFSKTLPMEVLVSLCQCCGNTSLFSIGLDKQKNAPAFESLIEKAGLIRSVQIPLSGLIHTHNYLVRGVANIYEDSKRAAEITGAPLNTLFWENLYANFLYRHKNKEEETARYLAKEAFH